MSKIFSLIDLLGEQMRDLFNAEENYLRLLPSFVSTSTSSLLREQFQIIERNTRQNIASLSHLCRRLNLSPHGVTCEAMDGLVREAKDHTCSWGDTATIDAALIANAQRIVHYEIAGFGTAKEFARCLELKDISQTLHDMLQVAFATDHALTRIATGGWFTTGINQEAADVAA